MKPKRRQLTAKQRAFCREYMVDLNATQACQRAGYKVKPKNADKLGSQLLGNTRVQAQIKKLQAKRLKRLDITAENVLRELAKIGFSSIKDFVEWEGVRVDLKNSDEISDEKAAVIAELSQTVTHTSANTKIKLHDKVRALNLLGRHLQLFIDRVAIGGDDMLGPVRIEDAKQELLDRVSGISARIKAAGVGEEPE